MAELNVNPGDKKRRRAIPRVDLTPMVDLGFLLITFFMYTTTMASPKTMEVNIPSNEPTPNPTRIIAESTITLIPVAKHRVVYYEGILEDQAQMRICAVQNIRDVLLQKQQKVIALPATFSKAAHKMYVVIKPNNDCTYADVVQLLDEMNIINAPYYSLVDVTGEEQKMIQQKFSPGYGK